MTSQSERLLPTVCFLLCADKEPYVSWCLAQAASLIDIYQSEGTLSNLFIEIVKWPNKESFAREHMRGVDVLQKFLGNRLLVRSPTCDVPGAQKGRFLEIPVLQADVTYVGDVDILANKGIDFITTHSQWMNNEFGTAISNVWRTVARNQITGCMAVKTEQYYNILQLAIDADKCQSIPVWKRTVSDEVMIVMLLESVAQGKEMLSRLPVGTPPSPYRPLVGMHISPNRGVGKKMNHAHYNEKGIRFLQACRMQPCMKEVLEVDLITKSLLQNIITDAVTVTVAMGHNKA